jgi:Flp pilus assembly protein TadG
MLTVEDKEYLAELHKLLAQRFEVRLSAIESELNQYRQVALTAEQSQKLVDEARTIFRSETIRINAWTRVSVAIVAALAVIGNGTSNVIVDHTETKAMAKYEHVTDSKLATVEARINTSNRQLLFDVKQVLAERQALSTRLEGMIVKAGTP